MTNDRMAQDGPIFVDNAIKDLKDDPKLQDMFVAAISSTSILGTENPSACGDVVHMFHCLIEATTKARAGAYFTKFKEEHASRNSKGGDDKDAFRGVLKMKAKANINKK